jgi:peptidyl-dipeptidase A
MESQNYTLNKNDMIQRLTIAQLEYLTSETSRRSTRLVINDLLMQWNYTIAKVCDYNDKTNCNLDSKTGLNEIFISSRDPEELKYYWLESHNRANDSIQELSNKTTEINESIAEQNLVEASFEILMEIASHGILGTIKQQFDAVVEQLSPLYKQLHAYVRFKLQQKYGESVVPSKGPIPMHLVGDLLARTWQGIEDFTTPFPDKKWLDVTDEMLKQGYTPVKMFQMGDEFFQSLNMTRLPQ